MISQYNFEDNPNLPRLLDSLKREFDIDLELDFVIEEVGTVLRMIGMNTKLIKTDKIKVKDGLLELPCFAEHIQEIRHCNYPVMFEIDYQNQIKIDKILTEVDVTYIIYPTDNNGFPKINNESVYYACLHWLIYKYLLKKFMGGVEDGNKLQFFENLKDKYINQARGEYKDGEKDKVIRSMYSTFNRKWR